MHLFTDYLQPLIAWLYVHPNWALLITFLVSFSESLAIIGTIIPGSVTMTAIGILAGSGVLRIDLTILASILGAVAGDSVSYALGYYFRNSIINIWPFSRYPSWLNYGKDHFSRHGGKSVLIGRFVGPLRSIIPVIAGMMHMNRWHFFSANFISAIGWSVLYVIPGVLIGAASSELSAETASRLFIIILIVLVLIWLVSLGIKWLLLRIHLLLRINLHQFWIWSKKHPRLAHFFNTLTPSHEINHYPTAALVIVGLLSFIISSVLTMFVLQEKFVAVINYPANLLLQSLHTKAFDIFFIVISLFINTNSLVALLLAITLYAFYFRDWRVLKYWLSLCISCAFIVFILAYNVIVPDNSALLKYNIHLFYPAINLTFATTLFSFLIFYISARYRTIITLSIRVFLVLLLLLAGFGSIYLGDNWLTSVLGAYFIGLTICIFHWIFYRKLNHLETRSQFPIVFSCLVLLMATVFSFLFYYKKLVHVHRPYLEQYVLTDQIWWHQQHPLLPLYATNRLGYNTGLFNIQYAGSIESFKQALKIYGWKEQSNSFFYSLLIRAGNHDTTEELPLAAQLYRNRKSSLFMTYNNGEGKPILILRLWLSNYHLQDYSHPIWLGTIYPFETKKLKFKYPNHNLTSSDPFIQILPALNGFEFNRVVLQRESLRLEPPPISPVLLLIKEPKISYDNKLQIFSPIQYKMNFN